MAMPRFLLVCAAAMGMCSALGAQAYLGPLIASAGVLASPAPASGAARPAGAALAAYGLCAVLGCLAAWMGWNGPLAALALCALAHAALQRVKSSHPPALAFLALAVFKGLSLAPAMSVVASAAAACAAAMLFAIARRAALRTEA